MIKSTLCYIKRGGEYLMLYRNRKKNDPNAGKWIGIGGKLEAGETPEEGMLREVREETGIKLTDYRFHGVIEFRSDAWEYEDMYLYSGEVPADTEAAECDEGELKWIPQGEILGLKLWEGDRVFLKPLLEGAERISLRLKYEGETLTGVEEI